MSAPLLQVSNRTSAQHRLSSELSPGEGRNSECCFFFPVVEQVKKQVKGKLHTQRFPIHTGLAVCLPWVLLPASLSGLQQHRWGWHLQPCLHTGPKLLGQGTTQYKAFPLSYEIIPGLGKTSYTGKGNS